MLSQIQQELTRLAAHRMRVSLDDKFDAEAGTLIAIELETAYWHLFPDRFLQLLVELPDEAGDEAIREAIERHEVFVWHGPAPPGSRDTSF